MRYKVCVKKKKEIKMDVLAAKQQNCTTNSSIFYSTKRHQELETESEIESESKWVPELEVVPKSNSVIDSKSISETELESDLE